MADFDEARLKGDGVADSLAKIAKSFELKDLSGIANAGTALDALGVKGKVFPPVVTFPSERAHYADEVVSYVVGVPAPPNPSLEI